MLECALIDSTMGLRLWHQEQRPFPGCSSRKQHPANIAMCCRPYAAPSHRAHGIGHRPRTLQHSRHAVRCSVTPFGRDIFGLIQPKQSDTSPQQLPADNVADMPMSQATTATAQLTPYSLFAALFMDRVYKEPNNPAFQQLATQHASKLSVVCGLWSCLQPEQQILFYQAFTPLCMIINSQQEARSGQPLRGLLQRIYAHLHSLPISQRDAINGVLLAATQQRLLRLHAAVSASQGVTEPSTPTSSSATQEIGSLLDAASTQDAEDPVLQTWVLQMSKDEQNMDALRVALDAAGFGHLVWQVGNLGGAMSITSRSEVRVHERKVPLGAAASDVRLVTHLRAPTQQDVWQDFITKCRLAWDVFFPASQVLTPAHAMRARLQMILVSDRSGLDLPTLMRIRNQSMAALAESNGWDNLSELELQVASTKASGEQVKLALPLTSMPERFMLRNADDYDYELYDDDDYEDDQDETKVGEIMEGHAALGGPKTAVITDGVQHL